MLSASERLQIESHWSLKEAIIWDHWCKMLILHRGAVLTCFHRDARQSGRTFVSSHCLFKLRGADWCGSTAQCLPRCLLSGMTKLEEPLEQSRSDYISQLPSGSQNGAEGHRCGELHRRIGSHHDPDLHMGLGMGWLDKHNSCWLSMPVPARVCFFHSQKKNLPYPYVLERKNLDEWPCT